MVGVFVSVSGGLEGRGVVEDGLVYSEELWNIGRTCEDVG